MSERAARPDDRQAGGALADNAPHLLLVDDDRRIRALMSRYLGGQGYRVTTAENAADARNRMRGLAFDLIVLDVMMPGENGVDFASSLRRESQVPILMLTALSGPRDRVRGLEAGVDDYLGKPFEPKELSLRIASILRRATAAPARAPPPPQFLRFGAFTFEIERGDLRLGQETVRLTDKERFMLKLLAQAPAERTATRPAVAGHGGVAAQCP